LGEYRFGIVQSRRRRDYEQWLGDMVSVSDVLAIDEETATCYAELRSHLKQAGTPIPCNDAWIAALCRQHGLAILSRDRHFDLIKGLRRLDW
jgi:predicted nucleic acid-binding protein